MGVDCNICSTKCFGIDNHHGSCCTLDNRDYIIGPHHDSNAFLERLSERFGREIKHNDVFIDYAEGSRMFPDKLTWQNPANFPVLRVDTDQPTLPCTFYNTKIKACTVHSIRPNTCIDYECDYLKEQTKTK
tara:strand:- start:951 stop:1343 length:393 start_codon:yes stop_codon:yes gene_type:complete